MEKRDRRPLVHFKTSLVELSDASNQVLGILGSYSTGYFGCEYLLLLRQRKNDSKGDSEIITVPGGTRLRFHSSETLSGSLEHGAGGGDT